MSVREPIDGDDGPDMVAAEYVLGLLTAEQMRAAEERIASDPGFADEVARWQGHFSTLDETYAPVIPPARVFDRIEQRLFGPAAGRRSALSRLWASLVMWRVLAAAAILIALAIGLRPYLIDAPQGPELVASLQADDSPVRFVALYDIHHHRLRFNQLDGERQAARDFQLWVIEGKNPPVSLGLLPQGDSVAVTVAAGHRGLLHRGAVLAISSEPLGGSPTGQPTGPVVAAGDMREL